MKKMLKTISASAVGVLLAAASACAAEPAASPDDIFRTAVAAWHMVGLKDASGRNELRIVGAVTLGIRLEGKELRDSLASGNDGLVARMEGGYLDAGQGTGGMLNLTGSALTVSVRLRSPSGAWGKPLFSKHGGHDRLVYNLFSFDSAIGFELGTRDTPGMTQVLAPLAKIGPQDWHDVICRYDGTNLQMFVDGVLMSEASPAGLLREGNTEPCLIGAESIGGGINSAWKGLIDHVAIWNRALSDAEIERLSGGAARVAALKAAYTKEPPVPPTPANLYREHRLTADKRYLIFPRARGKSGPDRVFVHVDGKPFLSVYDAPMAKSEPDFWTYLDLSLVQNKQITVRFEGPDAAGVELVRTSDVIPGKHPLYHEPGRPQVHFSPLRGWLNDPSGMIYFEGKWHLCYANTRFANVMAGPNNAWGHAVSSDLLHWEEAPLLLNPVRGKYSFWTGGAAVDVENTTGLGRPGKPALVFSANNGSDAPNAFTQCVFPSIDGGMSVLWNPDMLFKPLPKEAARRGGGTRDPMILWYAPEKKWVLVVYNQPPGGRNGFYFFESRDLKSWQETGVLEDMFECPNLFELPVDGNPANRRWVTWGSDTAYRIGTFNGKTFIPEGGKHRTHHGAYSASQVFANAPGGRIVQIGWAHVCDYDTEFTQMASFPLELSLKTTPEGVRLFAEFVPELAGLREEGDSRKGLVVKPGAPLRLGDVSKPVEIVAEFEPAAAARVTLKGPELGVAWNGPGKELEVNGQKVRLAAQNGVVRLHLLLDIPSVEVVSNGGENYVLRARNYQNLRPGSPLEIEVEGGDVLFLRLEVYPLKSIHPGAPDWRVGIPSRC